ncbi:GNAT family N-acetyltransferase (plasmid) [Embleya sp. NBC_00888]|uniref:GNAT family N-acetyltransferase n=1 Tax=Embleya sp. NBC_00888 TaxID=2975960 RepID=UPI002F908ADD|nr:GNAT family N-acetyltransferase [Embleya sp. NBC_00888]
MDQTRLRTEEYEFGVPDSWDRFADVVARAYGGYDAAPAYRAVVAEVFEPKRSLFVRRDGRPCATLALYSFDMGVPGGRRPIAGLGYITVDPTHRRRGLMRGMIQRTLAGLHERGEEPVAALHTTEPAIYGRFGFGGATRAVHLEIPRHARELTISQLEPLLPVRVAEPAECVAHIARIHDGEPDRHPGTFHRDDAWTRRALSDLPERRGGAGRMLCMLAEDSDEGGRPRGYALYALTARWVDSYPRYDVHVREVFAEDSLAYASVWRALLDIDLAGTVIADRPVDDPILALLADPRSAVPVVRDQLYTRVVDLERALPQRGYAAEIDLVLDLIDPDCPWNHGRWRLRTGADGASCARTASPAELSLSARELGAVYLGGTSLVQLAAAGRVIEHRAGAVRAAARAFRHDPAPFCPMVF